MQLYEFPPTRSIRPRWVLQELGVPFESVIVDPRRGELRSPGFLKLNPAARLPVLVDGERVLNESVAICVYLAEKYPHGGLMPTEFGARSEVNRWLWFTVTELEQPLWRMARHTLLYPEERRSPADVALAREDFAPMAAVVEQHLDGRQFGAGESFTVADIVLAYTLDWASEEDLLGPLPRSRAYLERMYARPNAALRIATAFASIS